MKNIFANSAVLLTIFAAASARAEPVALDCALLRSPDWIATVTIEENEITSLMFSNRSGSVVSSLLAVTRESEQTMPGYVFYRFGSEQPQLMWAEDAVLTGLAGRIYFQSPFVEEQEDVYHCSRR